MYWMDKNDVEEELTPNPFTAIHRYGMEGYEKSLNHFGIRKMKLPTVCKLTMVSTLRQRKWRMKQMKKYVYYHSCAALAMQHFYWLHYHKNKQLEQWFRNDRAYCCLDGSESIRMIFERPNFILSFLLIFPFTLANTWEYILLCKQIARFSVSRVKGHDWDRGRNENLFEFNI